MDNSNNIYNNLQNTINNDLNDLNNLNNLSNDIFLPPLGISQPQRSTFSFNRRQEENNENNEQASRTPGIGTFVNSIISNLEDNFVVPLLTDNLMNNVTLFPNSSESQSQSQSQSQSLQRLSLSEENNSDISNNSANNMNRLRTFTNIISEINSFDRIMNQSLLERPKFKKVLSEEGKKQLIDTKYSEDLKCNNSCPILQLDFEIDENIIMLPCNHVFNPEAIKQWTEEEKAECPVCRYELNSIEKRIENKRNQYSEQDISGTENIVPRTPVSSLSSSPQTVFQTPITTTTLPQAPGFRNPIMNYVNEFIERQEEEQLQRAIYESRELYEQEQREREETQEDQISSILNSASDDDSDVSTIELD